MSKERAVDWRLAMLFGAAGGAIVEIISLWGNLAAWQQSRKVARQRGRQLPSWRLHFDPWPDALVACTRLMLGAMAGLVFHGQVTGQTAAVAVGAAAPALLRQLGALRSNRDIDQIGTDTATSVTGTGQVYPSNGTTGEPTLRTGTQTGREFGR